MKYMAVMLFVILAGCDNPSPMTNDEIIAETKKCADAGMVAVPLIQALTGDEQIRKIQCRLKP